MKLGKKGTGSKRPRRIIKSFQATGCEAEEEGQVRVDFYIWAGAVGGWQLSLPRLGIEEHRFHTVNENGYGYFSVRV